VLGKITGAIAILFTITAFSLTLLGGERSSSVIRDAPHPASAPAPAAPAGKSTPARSAPAQPAPAPAPTGQEKPR
jgi:hypothetical protein